MKTEFRILRPNGEIANREADLPAEPTYNDLRWVLDPIFNDQRARAHFERVAVLGGWGPGPEDYGPTDMFVDDEGHLHGLPYNEEATRVYHRFSIARGEAHVGMIVPGAPTIAGIAVLFQRRVWF